MAQPAVTRAEYRDLDFVVQVQYDPERNGSWESMAAFNVKVVAVEYAKDCKKTNRRLNYRVLELSAIQPTYAIIFETNPAEPA